jgi:Anion-transporting ATPase
MLTANIHAGHARVSDGMCIIVYTGKGGVGKTSMAAATALRAPDWTRPAISSWSTSIRSSLPVSDWTAARQSVSDDPSRRDAQRRQLHAQFQQSAADARLGGTQWHAQSRGHLLVRQLLEKRHRHGVAL